MNETSNAIVSNYNKYSGLEMAKLFHEEEGYAVTVAEHYMSEKCYSNVGYIIFENDHKEYISEHPELCLHDIFINGEIEIFCESEEEADECIEIAVNCGEIDQDDVDEFYENNDREEDYEEEDYKNDEI